MDMKRDKTLAKVMSGKSDANISFADVRKVLGWLGFNLVRITGSHHHFSKDSVEGLITLQEVEGGKCKPYQVKQVRKVLKDNDLA